MGSGLLELRSPFLLSGPQLVEADTTTDAGKWTQQTLGVAPKHVAIE